MTAQIHTFATHLFANRYMAQALSSVSGGTLGPRRAPQIIPIASNHDFWSIECSFRKPEDPMLLKSVP